MQITKIRWKSEVSWVLLGQVIMFLGTFVGLKILTKTFGAEIYGQLALGLSIGTFINSFVFGPYNNSTLRFLTDYIEKKSVSQYLNHCIKQLKQISTVSLLLSLLITLAIYWRNGDSSFFLLIFSASLFGIISGIQTNLSALLGGFRERKVVALNQGAVFWLRFSLALLVSLALGKIGYALVIGYAIADLFVLFSQYFSLRKKHIQSKELLSSTNTQVLNRELVQYALPFVLWAIFNFLNTSADRWVIQWLFDERSVGIYTAVSQIAFTPVFLVAAIVTQYVVPIAYEQASFEFEPNIRLRTSERTIHKAAYATCAIVILGTLLSMPLHEWAVRLLTAEEFTVNSNMMWILVLSSGIFQIGQILSLYGHIYKNNYPYLVSLSAKSISFLLFSYLFYSRWGIYAIAYSHLISSTIYTLSAILMNNFIVRGKQHARS